MGPMTKEDKVIWDGWRAQKLDYQNELAEDEKLLRDNPNHEHKKMIQRGIEHSKKMLSLFEKANV